MADPSCRGALCRSRAGVALTLIGLVVSACGPGLQDPAEIPPPQIMANGVAGTVVSYCRPNYCADGAIDLRVDNPTVQLPVTLTFEEPIGHITAHVSALTTDDGAVTLIGADADGVPLAQTIRIEEWPEGDWQWLTVSAFFAGEVSVGASWELEASDGSAR